MKAQLRTASDGKPFALTNMGAPSFSIEAGNVNIYPATREQLESLQASIAEVLSISDEAIEMARAYIADRNAEITARNMLTR